MLKEEKVLKPMLVTIKGGKIIDRIGDEVIGIYGDDDEFIPIYPKDVIREINQSDFYFAEFHSEGYGEYRNQQWTPHLNGILLNFNIDESLYHIDPTIYKEEKWIHEDELLHQIRIHLQEIDSINKNVDQLDIRMVDDGYVKIMIPNIHLDASVLKETEIICNIINEYYERKYSGKSCKIKEKK